MAIVIAIFVFFPVILFYTIIIQHAF